MLKRQAFHSAAGLCAALLLTGFAGAAQAQSGLSNYNRITTLASTVPDNGDVNPYAVLVAPVTSGKIQKDDVLVDNFNAKSNLQGTGGTIIDYNPSKKSTTLFAEVPQTLPACPGGVGMSAAMAMLKRGWVIVGSAPSGKTGTTAGKGPGCLIVFDSTGKLRTVWSGPQIDDPWGDMAVVDDGSKATLFISMAGFGLPSPDKIDPATHKAVVVNKADVLRLQLAIPAEGPPKIVGRTVVADGLPEQADKTNFLFGPTGVVLIGSTLYVSDAVGNQIVAIDDATTRKESAGTGRLVTKDGLLKNPLALAVTPKGDILASNQTEGVLVEFNPASGKQVGVQWLDSDAAQSPPGNGDLFGIAVAPGGGLYFVEDDSNLLAEAR